MIGLTLRVIAVRPGEVVATATAESGAAHQAITAAADRILAAAPRLAAGTGSNR